MQLLQAAIVALPDSHDLSTAAFECLTASVSSQWLRNVFPAAMLQAIDITAKVVVGAPSRDCAAAGTSALGTLLGFLSRPDAALSSALLSGLHASITAVLSAPASDRSAAVIASLFNTAGEFVVLRQWCTITPESSVALIHAAPGLLLTSVRRVASPDGVGHEYEYCVVCAYVQNHEQIQAVYYFTTLLLRQVSNGTVE